MSLAQENEAARLYSAGVRCSVIAKRLGVGMWAIREAVRRSGVPLRTRGGRLRDFTERELADIEKRWRAGESQTAIGIYYRAGQGTISRVLRSHGLAPEKRIRRGEQHGSWKGGRVVLGNGYIGVRIEPEDPMIVMRDQNGYVMEHRLVMARYLGRPLTAMETVHHINGEHTDNRIENLQLRHGRHGNGTALRCFDCGSTNLESVALQED